MRELIPSVDLPEGKSGDWEIERFKVEDDFWYRLSLAKGCRRGVPIGEYTKLTCCGKIVMSDTPDEKLDHYDPVIKANGNVLIAGLGLGVVLNAIALKPEVLSITVIEKSQDVIDLVAPYYKEKFGRAIDTSIEIIHADIFEWKPPKGAFFQMAWYDIWNNLCADNLPEMTRLHRKFGSKTLWQGSWGKEILRDRRGY